MGRVPDRSQTSRAPGHFGALQILYYRVDAVILKSLSGNEAVGYYDLATRCFLAAVMISQFYGMSIFPAFSSIQEDAGAFGRLAFRGIKTLFLLGFPITVGCYFLA